MTLTEFLLARIDEDERAARSEQADAMVGFYWKGYPRGAYKELQARVLATSSRTLAECEAKQRIVEVGATWMDQASRVNGRDAADVMVKSKAISAETTLLILATVYADHPDYNPAWT